MAKYYYCSRIMRVTRSFGDLKNLLNLDLEGKRRKITYISGSMNRSLAPKEVKALSKSYRNGASKNLVQLGIDMQSFTLLWKSQKKEELVEEILNSDIVYLLGGNPIEQLAYIKTNGLDEILRSYEGIIVGVSGGAMTMSNYLIVPPCGEKYKECIIQKGLGLSRLNVMPHTSYTPEQNLIQTKDGNIDWNDLLKISKEYELLGLSNEGIIRYTEEGIYILGDIPCLLSDEKIHNLDYKEEKIDHILVKKRIDKK